MQLSSQFIFRIINISYIVNAYLSTYCAEKASSPKSRFPFFNPFPPYREGIGDVS